jgi:hypothetical protein
MRTDTPLASDQLLILATAARRPDRLVVPRPAGMQARGAVRRRLLAALLERGLAEELPTKDEGLTWRRDERGRHRALRLTSAGLAAVARPAAGPDAGSGEDTARRRAAKRSSRTAARRTAPKHEDPPEENGAYASQPGPRRPGGKLGRVLEAVEAEGGATLAELAGLTGWQPHTTLAALTRLRRRGYALERLDLDGRKAYRLGAAR